MRRHRTTARGVLLLFLALGLAGAASPAGRAKGAVPTLIFPVAGPTTYTDDFGQARAGGAHQGNDLLATKKTPVVAVESGKITFWTTSASAGCMLYLHGASGTMYEYIHLNNDLTKANDNRGTCVPGVAYAPGLRNGAKVSAGQLLGFVGDSGDANGLHAHLHFEVHPGGGAAVSPYPYLQAAQKLLFYAKTGMPFTLALSGTVVSATDTSLTLQLSTLTAYPMNLRLTKLTQKLTLVVPETAVVQPATQSLAASPGDHATVWTQPALATTKAMLGADGALTAALVRLG
jgi:hypothetical protein